LKKYVFHDILKVLKLMLIPQGMLAELITLTPRYRNEFIHYPEAKSRIEVLTIMDMKAIWNSTLELVVRAYHLRVFTSKWL
jgi:hypothetical protein